MSGKTAIRLGLIGCGTVGRGVVALLANRPDCQITHIAVRSPEKHRDFMAEELPQATVCQDPMAVATHPDVDVLVEVAGGVDTAEGWMTAALKAGKPVVTANKDCMATHGHTLRACAEQHNVPLLYEAAVAAGIPLVAPLKTSLAANRITRLAGILNGTCNYMLTRMAQEGWGYSHALEQAQAKGFAEADPTNDVGGKDTAYKLSILTRLAFGQSVSVDDMLLEGITTITDTDMQLADEFGFAIKLLGIAQSAGEALDVPNLDVRVHPVLLAKTHPLASVANEFNALWVQGHAVGELMFYGRGAGELPTASGVCGDVLSVVAAMQGGALSHTAFADPALSNTPMALLPVNDIASRYYIRLVTQDTPGVVGTIGTICGNAGLSLESVIQQGVTNDGHANIVLMTQMHMEGQCQQALEAFNACETIESVACMLRVLD